MAKNMYHDYEQKNNKMDGKSKHPFAITCRKCGCNDIKVTAFDYYELEIKCQGCGCTLECGTYFTKQYDYSAMVIK